MEQKLIEAKPDQVLPQYILDDYMQKEFYHVKSPSIDKQPMTKKFIGALDFISKNIKRDANYKCNDFIVCFLEAFNFMFPD